MCAQTIAAPPGPSLLPLRAKREQQLSPRTLAANAAPSNDGGLALGRKKLSGHCIVLMHGEKTLNCDVEQSTEAGASLQEYMSRASENFGRISLPLGGRISTLDSSRIELVIPRITLFDVWLQPRAIAELSSFNERIEFKSTTESCVLDGSSHVKDFKLDERFNLDVKMAFTWKNKAAPGAAAGGSAPGSEDPSSSSSPLTHAHDKIYATGDITIEVDIPPPFSFIPKPVLESTANAALAASIAIILNEFVTQLSRDYAVWAQGAAARREQGAQAPAVAPVVPPVMEVAATAPPARRF